MIRRLVFDTVQRRLAEPPRFLQVLAGPRQVGKTTLVRQVLKEHKAPTHCVSADLVLHQGRTTVAIEVKSGRRQETLPGMAAFARQFKPKRQLLVGGEGIPVEEFLLKPAGYWLE